MLKRRLSPTSQNSLSRLACQFFRCFAKCWRLSLALVCSIARITPSLYLSLYICLKCEQFPNRSPAVTHALHCAHTTAIQLGLASRLESGNNSLTFRLVCLQKSCWTVVVTSCWVCPELIWPRCCICQFFSPDETFRLLTTAQTTAVSSPCYVIDPHSLTSSCVSPKVESVLTFHSRISIWSVLGGADR